MSILGAGFVSQVAISDFKDTYNNAGSADTVEPMTVEKQRVPTHLTLNKLPSMPQVLVRILDAVSQESADFQHLSDIIRQDSAMSARLIAVANSSYYRRQYSCDTVDRALMCLGLETVRTLVITAAVKQYFSHFDKNHQQFMRQFWRRSLVSAHCAQTVASLTGYQALPQAYLCGLLMDVGQLCLLAENDSVYLPILASAGGDDQQLLDAERSALETTHPELGAALLDSWQLDNFMADALRYHHAGGVDIKHAHHLVKIVNLSSLMSSQAEPDDKTLTRASDLFGFNEDLLRELHARIAADVQRIAGGLGVASGEAEDPEQAQQANRELGEKLGQLAQLQALRQTLPRDAVDVPEHDAVGRALYLSFGFEKYVIFRLREEQGTLEASLGETGSGPGSGSNMGAEPGVADFVVDTLAEDNLVQRSFSRQQIQTSNLPDGDRLSLLDEQLLRYCRQPALIYLPFAAKHQRGILVAGANPVTLAQQQQNAGLWQTLLNEITVLFDRAPAVPGQQVRDSESARISEAVHEVSNPLSVINNYLEILRLKLGDSKDADKEFAILREEIDRVGKILLRLNKPGEYPETESVDVNAVVDDLGRIFRESMCAARDVRVKLELDSSLQPVLLNKVELKQVLTNLIKNAVEAMPSGGTLTLRSEGRVMVNGHAHLTLTIADTGAGIPERVMSRLFVPGVTSKGDAHGGLGLSVVKKLMDAMKAQIVCSSSDQGTQFRLLFPVTRSSSPQES
ncbi:MAG: HDOD domain-containing protein [Pseudohongiella sp.]|uniref:HDOD domain-containing protein n=1 Tax=Pseudohongiella sp. TaxID=1979412 RepID=UPI0034A0AD67